MAYPSTLTAFTDPAATEKLSNPSHSSIEAAQNAAITQLEKVVGRQGGASASALGTIIGDLRNATSPGGGHVQTAVKGGTGQTSYTKGDILVAQSASVLEKLALGTDSQVLTADSSVASGVKWGGGGIKIYNTASIISYVDSVAETSVFSTTIPGRTLGTSGAVRATAYVKDSQIESSVLAKALYGGDTIASIMVHGNGITSVVGTFQYILMANASTDVQRATLTADLRPISRDGTVAPSLIGILVRDSNTASVASEYNKTMGMTIRSAGSGANDYLFIDGVIVERIN